MATLKISKSSPGKVEKISKPEGIDIVLPWDVDEPVSDINYIHMLFTGEPGIGKSTLGQQEPNVLNLSSDPLRKSLKGVIQRHVPDWPTSMAWLQALEQQAKKKGKFYKRIIIDGVDLWYRGCFKWCCKKLAITHPSDEQWGKGWDFIKNTYIDALDRFMALPCGIWFICHAQEKEIEKRNGSKVQRLAPVLNKSFEEVLVGKVEAMFNIHYEGGDRIMTVRADDYVSAKCDIDGHFLTPNGDQIYEILLGNKGPAEAYQRMLKAYRNEQTYTTYEELRNSKERREKKEKK